MTPPRFAVIPTYNRPDYLASCLDAINPQVEMTFVIDNGSDPPVSPNQCITMRYPVHPPNLSKIWNLGIKMANTYADAMHVTEWDIAILNDDTVPQPDWMERVCSTMRDQGGIAACTMPGLGVPIKYDSTAHWGIGTRVTGWAFVLRGEANPEFDEQFEWWCGDDDISVWARSNGGLVVVPGMEVPNLLANSSTAGELLAQSAVDMQRFVDKHGKRPW